MGRNTTLYLAPHDGTRAGGVQAKHWWFSGKIGHCQLLLNCLAPGSIPGQCIFASTANWLRRQLRALLVFCNARRMIAKRYADAASGWEASRMSESVSSPSSPSSSALSARSSLLALCSGQNECFGCSSLASACKARNNRATRGGGGASWRPARASSSLLLPHGLALPAAHADENRRDAERKTSAVIARDGEGNAGASKPDASCGHLQSGHFLACQRQLFQVAPVNLSGLLA